MIEVYSASNEVSDLKMEITGSCYPAWIFKNFQYFILIGVDLRDPYVSQTVSTKPVQVVDYRTRQGNVPKTVKFLTRVYVIILLNTIGYSPQALEAP